MEKFYHIFYWMMFIVKVGNIYKLMILFLFLDVVRKFYNTFYSILDKGKI